MPIWKIFWVCSKSWSISGTFLRFSCLSMQFQIAKVFFPLVRKDVRRKRLLGKFFRFYLLSVPLFVYLIATGVVKSGNDCIFGNRNQTFNWKSFHCVSWYLGNGRKKLVGLIGKVSVYGKLFSGKRFLWKSIKEGRLERRLEARIPRKRENWEWWVTRIDDGNICSSSFSLVIPRVNQFIRMMIHGWVKRKEK